MNKLSFRFATVLLIAILGVMTAMAQDNGNIMSDGYPVNTITVSGTGTASGIPDIANVEIGVQTVDADLSSAFAQTNTQLDAVIDAIVAVGVSREDIRTTGLDIFQQERFDIMESGLANGEQPRLQFNVSNRVRVIVRDVSLIETVLTAAVDAGANQIFGLSFGIDDQDTLLQEARLLAVESARANAEQLATAVDAQLGEVIIITEGQGSGLDPFNVRNFGEQAQGGDFDAVIEPGQLNVSVSVSVTYRLVR